MVKSYTPHLPSQKQRLFLNLDCEEAFYGGAAGGGKSDALIEGALQYVDVPGYSAGLFRRTKEDLNKPKAILDRARTWFAGTAARWDDKLHGYRFPSGATIHFGYGTNRQEIEDRYQGPEFQYIGVDELGQWLEAVYTYLFSRLRRLVGHPVPIRMRAAGNPGGRGAEWVRRRFVESARLRNGSGFTVKDLVAAHKKGERLPDDLVFVSPPSTQALESARRFGREAQGAYFVPAYAEDNPGLDYVEYMLELSKLDAETRNQLEHGDWWAAAAGAFFQAGWFQYAEAPPTKLIRLMRVWDLAATKPRANKDPDWSAGGKMARHLTEAKEDQIWILHADRTRDDPGATEDFVQGYAKADGKQVEVVIEEEPGSAGKNNTHNYAAKVLPGYRVVGVRKTGPKAEYWKGLSADAKNGRVYLVEGPWNSEVVQELCALTVDDAHAHDDYADCLSMGRARLYEDLGLERLRSWAQ